MRINHHRYLPEKVVNALSFFSGATIYLYGSYLTGTFHEKSDIDLLVLTDNIRTEEDVLQWKKDMAPLQISIIQMTERSFNQNRNHSYYFAPQLEEIGRWGRLLQGNIKINSLLTDEEFIFSTWLTVLFELSQLRFTNNNAHKEKVLARGTILTWELERLWSLKGSFSLGIAAQRLMQGELNIPQDDRLADFLNESGILWKWVDLSIIPNNEEILEQWAGELKARLSAHSQILNLLNFRPLTQEGLVHLKNHSLYANISWRQYGKGLVEMNDLGRQFIINFVKICLSRS